LHFHVRPFEGLYVEAESGQKKWMQRDEKLGTAAFLELSKVRAVDPESGEEVSLVGLPKSRADLYGLGWVKRPKDYLCLPWDLTRSFKEKSRDIMLENGESVDVFELFVLSAVFDKHKAHRNEAGALVLLDPNTGEEFKFSVNRVFDGNVDTGIAFRQRTKGSSTLAYLLATFPDLFSAELFRESDFRQSKEGGERLLRTASPINEKGSTYVKGSGAYILGIKWMKQGEKYESFDRGDGTVRVDQILETGERRPVYLFNLASEEIIRAKKEVLERRIASGEIAKPIDGDRSLLGRMVFGLRESAPWLNFRPYKESDENKQLTGETAAEYADRIRGIASVQDIRSFERDLLIKAGLSSSTLSEREREWLATAAKDSRVQKERIIAGSKDHGINFLRSFLATETSASASDAILWIVENYPEDDAKAIFKKYCELVDASFEVEAQLSQLVGSVDDEKRAAIKRNTNENLLQRGRTLFEKAVPEKKKIGKPQTNYVEEIERICANTLALAHIYKAMKVSGEKIEIEKMLGIEIDTESKPTREEREDMVNIFRLNHRDLAPKIAEYEQREFEKTLDGVDQKFPRMRHYGNVIVFGMFEIRDGGRLYGGSYNVHPEYRKYSIGPAFGDSILEKEAKNTPIDALSALDQMALPHYLAANKFVLTGIVEDGGKDYFTMRIERGERDSLRGPFMENAEIALRAKLVHGNDDDIVVVFGKSGSAELEEKMKELFKKKMVCGRLFRPKNEQGEVGDVDYFVFETGRASA